MEIDETMSQDMAFTGNGESEEDVFKFNEPGTEETPTASQAESEQVETPSDSQEDKQSAVQSEEAEQATEEQRVPYSRFKSKIAEVEQKESIIKGLEERLSSLEQSRIESKPLEDIEVPSEWTELYGDSDVSKRAFKVQLQREAELMERATKNAIEQLKQESVRENEMANENAAFIDESLESLQKTLGKKLTNEIEEEVLTIVDEFSPLDENGKYVSIFPFDKAYEIFQLRNAQASQKTNQARTQVANLAGNTSEGATDTSDSNFKRGWDNWREAL